MRILHTVEFYYPFIGGAQEVVRHLSERMVRAGHDVTVATAKLPYRENLEHNGVKIVEFNVSGNSVNGIKGEKKKYADFLINQKFDIIMTYAAQQWTADIILDNIDKIKARKVFVPCGYSALYDPAYEEYFKALPSKLKKFDATVYLSNDYRDINFAREHKISNIHIIPNGADENEFSEPLDEQRKRELRTRYGLGGLLIMHIGNYTGEKGHIELLEVFRKLPISKATLITAGTITPGVGCFDEVERQAEQINLSRKHIGKRVVMLDGKDRQTVKDVLMMSDIFVFLSNIEASPLVIFEAAAAGSPFVASAAGNIAEIAQWTASGIVVKTHNRPNGRVVADKKDALWQVTKLAHDKKKRLQLGENGKAAWEKNYTWDKLAKDYLNLYQKILMNKKVKK